MKKRIVCFGDSNTWGYDAVTGGRFPDEVRWTGVLQEILGAGYDVIEEGLCGRTTVFEDPLNEGLSGLEYLLPCLMSHSPAAYLVIMLGTNDCKERFSAPPKNIADGLKRLIVKARHTEAWSEQSPVAGEMGICSEKSERLAEEYRVCAEEHGCEFLDAGPVVRMNRIDYMHLDAESHKRLASEIAAVIRRRI